MSTYGAPIHDRNGNVATQPGFGGATAFAYDLNNRATAIVGPSVNAAMKYFGDGKLAQLDFAGVSHRFLVDPTATGNRVLAELDQGGGVQIGYTYGPSGMVSQVSGGQSYAFFHNLQGSTVALADSTGAVKNSYRYDPFGRELASSAEQVGNLFDFLGGFSVPSIGRYSITANRVYDSVVARFTGVDRAYYDRGRVSSRFIYAGQSPISLVDPSGLMSQLVSVSFGNTAGSTPASLLALGPPVASSASNPCPDTRASSATQVECGLNISGTLLSAASALGPSDRLAPIVDAANNVLSVPSLALSAAADASKPNLSAGMKIGRTSANLALGLNPFVAVPYGAASIMWPKQTDASLNWTLNTLGSLGANGIDAVTHLTGTAGAFENWASTPNWWDY
jgi:RHS repeat-associated protein